MKQLDWTPAGAYTEEIRRTCQKIDSAPSLQSPSGRLFLSESRCDCCVAFRDYYYYVPQECYTYDVIYVNIRLMLYPCLTQGVETA